MKQAILLKPTPRRIGGYFVFLLSLVLYSISLSPTANFWDCGEFIACADRLQVGHAPGAPLYLMIARLFSAFVPAGHVAASVNFLSALASAATVWLMYSTLLLILDKLQQSKFMYFPILASIVASLSFAVSDTFWFSAVEAEVYALSIFFTAFSLWAVLKWEAEWPSPTAHRWLLLIAFTMGLSVGVHLLNLLCIPVVFYWVHIHQNPNKNYKHLVGLLLGLVVLLAVQFLVIQNGLFLAKKMELLLVNSLYLPVQSGLILFVIVWIGLLIGSMVIFRKRCPLLYFILLSLVLFTLGLSSYAMVIIRANAETAINLNSPKNVFSLESFINREQYGERPLIVGPWFGAKYIHTEPVFSYRLDGSGRYEHYEKSQRLKYDKQDLDFVQRMYSAQPLHIDGYSYWGGLEAGEKPTLMQQGEFMFRYQLGHMYFRYFMWNFSGRQNHLQGHGDFLHGNFTTGLPFIDRYSLGSRQYLHSNELTSKARNYYFMLPLLFGLGGILLLIKKKKWDLLVLLGMLFLLTGAAITLYLNPPPYEPRERDYIFVGSFYAFSIFIGLGVWALLQKIEQLSSSRFTRGVASGALLLALPGLMLANNFNDHSRASQTLARDMSLSYLESCDANAILFVYGDNDTYPLWYLQEVEGIRRDVSVINLGLLSADWYVEQQTIAQQGRDVLQFSIPLERYKTGAMDMAAVVNRSEDAQDVHSVLRFLGDTSSFSQLTLLGAGKLDYLPSNQLRMDSTSGAVLKIDKNYLVKGEIALLDIIASNGANRAVYFSNGTPASAMLGLGEFVRPYGLVSKLCLDGNVPTSHDLYILLNQKIQLVSSMNTCWDETSIDAIRLSGLEQAVQNLVSDFLDQGKLSEAQQLLIKYEVIGILPYRHSKENVFVWFGLLYKAGLKKQASAYLEKSIYLALQNFSFYSDSEQYLGLNMAYYALEEEDILKTLRTLAVKHNEEQLVQLIDDVLVME